MGIESKHNIFFNESNNLSRTAVTFNDGFLKIMRDIYVRGIPFVDERGSNTYELTNYLIKITNPQLSVIPQGYEFSHTKMMEYIKQFISEDVKGFDYTYGNRLIGHFVRNTDVKLINGKVDTITETEKVNQLDKVVERLENNYRSRRAVLSTFDPTTDHYKDEIPCMIVLDFKIRLDRATKKPELNITGLWRSHDMYLGWLPNMFGVLNVAEYVAEKTKTTVGSITTHSISGHVYGRDIDTCRKFANEGIKKFGMNG